MAECTPSTPERSSIQRHMKGTAQPRLATAVPLKLMLQQVVGVEDDTTAIGESGKNAEDEEVAEVQPVLASGLAVACCTPLGSLGKPSTRPHTPSSR